MLTSWNQCWNEKLESIAGMKSWNQLLESIAGMKSWKLFTSWNQWWWLNQHLENQQIWRLQSIWWRRKDKFTHYWRKTGCSYCCINLPLKSSGTQIPAKASLANPKRSKRLYLRRSLDQQSSIVNDLCWTPLTFMGWFDLLRPLMNSSDLYGLVWTPPTFVELLQPLMNSSVLNGLVWTPQTFVGLL